MARSFVWLAIGGGAWSLAANWNDTTDGVNPSTVAPGAADSVMVGGPTGAQQQTITGSGVVAAAMFTGNTMLSGTFDIAALMLGQSASGAAAGGLLELAGGTSLAAGSANLVSGSLLVGGGSVFSASGAVGLGSALAGSSVAMDVTGGGMASVGSLFLGQSNDSIYVDPKSVLEVGGSGLGRAGQLTVDAGGLLSGQGNANAYGAVTNGGTILASGGTLSIGAVSGTGTLEVGAAATLALHGACGPGQAVDIAGAGGTLALDEEFWAPSGTLSGFAVGDAIDVVGSQISGTSFAVSATGTGGVLTLLYGTQTAVSLTLAGSYGADVFLTAGDGHGGTLITVAAQAGTGGGAPVGTQSADQYVWTGAGANSRWNQNANWSDTSKQLQTANVPPGANDLVEIGVAAGSFTVINGPANAASLNINGAVALGGAYALGTLSLGVSGNAALQPGMLDLVAGTTITAGSVLVANGAISAAGSASALRVSGTLTLGGGPVGIGLPTGTLSVTAGGDVQAACVVMGGGQGAGIVTDPTGIVEVGSAGGAAAGAVSVDAGAVLSGNGAVNPYGLVVDNGTILASGGTLSLGTVSGSGSLVVAAGATLELVGAASCAISLLGSAQAGGSVLAFDNERMAPGGTITGLAIGDAIHLEGSSATSVIYVASTGVLTLYYGPTAVSHLSLAANIANVRFVLTPDGAGGSLVTMTNVTGGGGGGTQSGTDTLAWTNPVSGGWNRAASWTDVTTSSAASAAPGAQTPVMIAGPTGATFQSISGTGTCASLSVTGNTLLAGTFSVGAAGSGALLTVGSGAILEVGVASSLVASQVVVSGGELISAGGGAVVSVAGTVFLGGSGALLAASAKSVMQCGALSLTDSSSDVTVDVTASLEVGTAGAAALGALTVDAGAQVSGAGSLNLAGGVIDNGGIVAQGGTLWVGAVSGAGSLSIGTEATLALVGGDACPVVFAGGGASLLLANTPPAAAVISGFAAGDTIDVAQVAVDGVSYSLGSNGLGTLSLTAGGVAVGQLMLVGNYAGDVFGVQPLGAGAAITVAAMGASGPPAGTVTPDSYVWVGQGSGAPASGAPASGAWATAANWQDVTQGQDPAVVAPGAADTVFIAGGTGSVLRVGGPADAAALAESGTLALSGAFSVGTLSVGSVGAGGVLALAGGASVQASVATVAGAIGLSGGVLGVAGTLTLGAGEVGGVLDATGGSVAELGSAVLAGPGCALVADTTSGIEVGGTLGPAAGDIVVDTGGMLGGQGSVMAAGVIVDQGSIVASGGTLLLGSVAGSGSLLVGVAATLSLQGSVGAGVQGGAGLGLTVDFAGAGTLLLGQAALAGAASAGAALEIADFGAGDQIILAVGGATSASYVETAPGIGLLSLEDGSQNLAQLILLGDQDGLAFDVAGSAGGGTTLTVEPDTTSGSGGGYVINPTSSGGSLVSASALEASLQTVLPFAMTELANLLGNSEVYEWFSVDGQSAGPAALGEPNVELVGPLNGQTGAGAGPGLYLGMQAGYRAVLLEGQENVQLSDSGLGDALLVGNGGADQIAALGDNDTLVGAAGANTVFYASLSAGAQSSAGYDVTIIGGGNDTIASNADAADIITSGGRSEVFLGAPQNGQLGNSVTLHGADTIICGGSGGVQDNVTVAAVAGLAGNLTFCSPETRLNFVGGATASTVVGNGGVIQMQGGSADGNILWGGNSQVVSYEGGNGSAVVIGGSGQTYVQGGAGPVTVFGGSGQGNFSGGAGSVFVVGDGSTNVQAGAGSSVFVVGGANVTVAGGAGVEVYAGSSLGHDVLQAGSGRETLYGGHGSDTLQGGSGSAFLASSGGSDVFSFVNGFGGGSDTVVGFVAGQDTLHLQGYGPNAPAITYAYGDSILNLSDGTQIIVYNVSNLSASSITTG